MSTNLTPTPPAPTSTLLLKQRELDLKARTLEIREKQLASAEGHKKAKWYLEAVLMAAVVALISAVTVAYLNNQNTVNVEHFKAQSSLIIEAIKAGDTNKACENLVFFLHLGLIDDQKGSIVNTCPKDTKGLPSLPAVGITNSGEVFIIVLDERAAPIADAIVHLQAPAGSDTGRTLGNGVLRLPPLPLGQLLDISVEKAGYKPEKLQTTWGASPITIVLHRQ